MVSVITSFRRATAEKDFSVSATPSIKLLPGEIITFAPNERVYWSVFGGKTCKQPFFVPGVLYMTNFRVVFMSTRYVSPCFLFFYEKTITFFTENLPHLHLFTLVLMFPHSFRVLLFLSPWSTSCIVHLREIASTLSAKIIVLCNLLYLDF